MFRWLKRLWPRRKPSEPLVEPPYGTTLEGVEIRYSPVMRRGIAGAFPAFGENPRLLLVGLLTQSELEQVRALRFSELRCGQS